MRGTTLELEGSGKFYPRVVEELRGLNIGAVYGTRSQFRASRGVQPADAVVVGAAGVIVVEIKSPKELHAPIPLSEQKWMRFDYLAGYRAELRRRIDNGQIPYALARHMLYLAQAEYYAHTFAGGKWALRAAPGEVQPCIPLWVGYAVPKEHQKTVAEAFQHLKVTTDYRIHRGSTTCTIAYQTNGQRSTSAPWH